MSEYIKMIFNIWYELVTYSFSESSRRSEYSGDDAIGNSEALLVDLTNKAVNSAVLLLLITLLPWAETAAPATRAEIGFHQGRNFRSFFCNSTQKKPSPNKTPNTAPDHWHISAEIDFAFSAALIWSSIRGNLESVESDFVINIKAFFITNEHK